MPIPAAEPKLSRVADPSGEQGSLAQRVRLHVYEHFVEHSRPPVVEELMETFSMTRAQTVEVLRELVDARHIALVRGTARILMAFPFSAIATPFRVRADGRDYFANCAGDAVELHSMLAKDIEIDSHCHHCGGSIRIDMTGGSAARVEPQATIVYLALRPTQWWEDIITTCSNTMVFFCSVEHRDASDLAKAEEDAASLTPDEVHALGVPLYSRRLSIDYERPGRDALTAHFASLGLTSRYWQL